MEVQKEAQRIMTMSVWKMYHSRLQRGGLRLHRSLQLSLVMRSARELYLSAKLEEEEGIGAPREEGAAVPCQPPPPGGGGDAPPVGEETQRRPPGAGWRGRWKRSDFPLPAARFLPRPAGSGRETRQKDLGRETVGRPLPRFVWPGRGGVGCSEPGCAERHLQSGPECQLVYF
uniref:Immediate early response 2 n=1 Tax=Pelusios castaneus TaxID=367368 RepID=A0A8C8VPR3_9SAUR